MNKDKIIKYILIALSCLFIIIIGYCLDKAHTVRLYDKDGNEVGQIIRRNNEIEYKCAEEVKTYVDVAWHEAIQIIVTDKECMEADAIDYLISNGVSIYTELDVETNDMLDEVLQSNIDRITDDYAVAITDLEGNLMACCSYSTNEDRNFLITPTYAASAIKPLSVYAPAIEEGIINWSTLVNDSPVIKIHTVAGEEDWPKNVEYYTYEDITIAEALQKSYNTVAVKVLKLYGVEKSCDYISQNFGIDVVTERNMLEAYGEDEILGNIALGYLRNGVTVKDMSGYYQVFANGGTYTNTHSINYMLDNNTVIYSMNQNSIQVMSEETAYICNRILKLVVSEGGTASGLNISDVDICAKTGTSDDFKDNWLIGFSPEYVCAVWYSSTRMDYENDENFSMDIYTEIMSQMNHNTSLKYQVPENIEEKYICKLTGLCATESCKNVFRGYYIKNTEIKECDCR